MLAINGGIRIWYVEGITNMGYGKYRLFNEVKALGRDPYNGDAYVFLNRSRHIMKLIRYSNHKRYLYDITYEEGYRFMHPVTEGDKTVYELDFKYLVALLECPVVKKIHI